VSWCRFFNEFVDISTKQLVGNILHRNQVSETCLDSLLRILAPSPPLDDIWAMMIVWRIKGD